MGKHITESLLAGGKHKITAITRADSTNKVPEGVSTKKVNYEDESSLVSALKGQEVLIITMGVMAPPDTQAKLINAAAKAGVTYILPNEWGFDHAIKLEGVLAGLEERSLKARQLIESHGMTWIGVTCGFWYEFSLAGSQWRYGFDFPNKTLVFFDDGTAKINTSSWPQCGKAVANLLSLRKLPDSESDPSSSPTLSQFANSFIRIASFLISQRDMFASVLRVTHTTESDWKITHENSTARYEDGIRKLQGGDRTGFGQLMYTRVFFPNGDGDYETRHGGLNNEELGLGKEDLDTYTKVAVEMAKAGTKY